MQNLHSTQKSLQTLYFVQIKKGGKISVPASDSFICFKETTQVFKLQIKSYFFLLNKIHSKKLATNQQKVKKKFKK